MEVYGGLLLIELFVLLFNPAIGVVGLALIMLEAVLQAWIDTIGVRESVNYLTSKETIQIMKCNTNLSGCEYETLKLVCAKLLITTCTEITFVVFWLLGVGILGGKVSNSLIVPILNFNVGMLGSLFMLVVAIVTHFAFYDRVIVSYHKIQNAIKDEVQSVLFDDMGLNV